MTGTHEGSTFLRPQDLASRWGISKGSLSNQRSKGEGVPYVRIGGLVRYRLSDIEHYENTRTEAPA